MSVNTINQSSQSTQGATVEGQTVDTTATIALTNLLPRPPLTRQLTNIGLLTNDDLSTLSRTSVSRYIDTHNRLVQQKWDELKN